MSTEGPSRPTFRPPRRKAAEAHDVAEQAIARLPEVARLADLRATLRPATLVSSLDDPPYVANERQRADETPLPPITLTTAENVRRGQRAYLEVSHTIAEGGMGRVLRAHQPSLQREVAVKTTPIDGNRMMADAIVLEARVTGQLEHPGIVPVHALGVDADGQPVMVMRCVDGVSWAELLADPQHPRWSGLLGNSNDRLAANIDVLLAVCNAVHYAHTRGIVHRDIKPANVMVGAFGEAYLVDWGVAHRVSAREPSFDLVGTPAYMAPELVTRSIDRIDARTDVYLLGATLHEVLTGDLRHRGDTLVEVLARAYTSEPVAYDKHVPAELAELCNDATCADPSCRPQTVLAFRQRLLDFNRHRESVALAEQTYVQLDELTALLARDKNTMDAQLEIDMTRLSAACLYGFRQALRGWPENRVAHEGMTQCLVALARHEMSFRNVLTAQRWIDEMDPAPREVVDELRALEALLQREEHDAFVAFEKARSDEGVIEQQERRNFFLLMAGILGPLAGYRVLTGRYAGHGLDATRLILFAVAFLSGAVAALYLGRRVILRRDKNRQLVSVVIAASGTILAHRIHAALFNATDLSHVVSLDFLMLAGFSAYAGAMLHRWMWFLCAASLVGSMGLQWFPSLSPWAFFTMAMGVLASFGRAWLRNRPAK